MKNVMLRSRAFAMLTSKFVITLFSAAILSLVPYHMTLAQSEPNLGAAGGFAILGGTAVTLTNSTVIGNVGVNTGGTITETSSTILGTIHNGDAIATQAYNNFVSAYDAVAANYPCTGSLLTVYTDTMLTLTPGVYCNNAAVTFTRTTLTLDAQGDANAVWIFKIGTLGTGALTGTSLTVVLANGAQMCNVYWWTADAVTMTTSNFKGILLSGAAVTFTGGSVIGGVMAKAGITMTGTDVSGCTSILPKPPSKDCKDYCKRYWKHFCKHDGHGYGHDKDKGKCYNKDHKKYDKKDKYPKKHHNK